MEDLQVSQRSKAGPLRWRAGLALIIGCLLAGSCRSPSDSRTDLNVILISLDTLRADHLSLYGYERDTSPNLDAIASHGIVFETAVSQASSTAPSHRSLLTSRYPSLATGRVQLSEVLRRAGFATAAFTGGGQVSASLGFGVGFETYFEAGVGNRSFREVYPRMESWLSEERNSNFFIFLHSYDIHYPYTAPEPYQRMFFPENAAETGVESRAALKKMRRARGPWDSPREVVMSGAECEHIVALYDGGIKYADTYLGRLRQFLQSEGLWDQTIVIVVSDHGEEFWEHGSALHSHTLYQELLHVPLVFRLPGGRFGGQRIAEPVQLMDVAPTVLDLLGLPQEPSFLGRSIVPLMSGEKRQLGAQVLVSEMANQRAFFDWPIKLIADRGGDSLQMFDLNVDPRELTDLSAQDSHAAFERYHAVMEMAPELGGRPDQVLEAPSGDEELKDQLRVLGYIE